jgi:ATP-dependent DNA helicase RecG
MMIDSGKNTHILNTSVTELKGVGKVATKNLHENGLFTVKDLLLLKPVVILHKPLITVSELKDQNLLLDMSNPNTWQKGYAIKVTVTGIRQLTSSRYMIDCVDINGHVVQGVSFDKAIFKYMRSGSKWILEGIPTKTGGNAVLITQSHWHKFSENWNPFQNEYNVKKIKTYDLYNFLEQSMQIVESLKEPVIQSLIAIHKNNYRTGGANDLIAYRDLCNAILTSKYNTCRDMLKKMEVANANSCAVEDWKSLEWPFVLTKDQQATIQDIITDIKKTKPMSRMVQGDVGSGKTAVALMAAQYVADAGFNSVFMAPTNVLAMQHYEKAQQVMRCKVFFLNNKTKISEKREIFNYTEPCLIIGTHAITYLEEIKNLAFAVIDEQHKFGVQQRLRLRKAGVHALSMSATPIPRSLCLTSLGYLQLSIIHEKPPGRSEIATMTKQYHEVDEVYQMIASAINDGHVVYWVCHRVLESLTEDRATVERRAKVMEELFPGQVISMFGGTKDKEMVMEEFKSGKKPILVASTVVEVGMDIKNAKMMIIEQSERFGLAQLHQLRGRVGRGDLPGVCVLLYSDEISAVGRQRLAIIEELQDGFEIALKDQEMRGSGDVLGTKQSGNKQDKFFHDLVGELEDFESSEPTEVEKALWNQSDLKVLDSV